MQVLTERGLYQRRKAQAMLMPGPDFDRAFRGRLRYEPDLGFYVGPYAVEDGDHIKFYSHGDGERLVRFKHDGLIDGVRI